jgi:LysR family transcriptional regulator, nitrogen assimilation regulatory protein
MLTLPQCRIFSELALQGSLSRAAAALNNSSPALSRKLAAIEKQIGGALFYRTGRGLLLTDMGERLLPYIERLLHEATQLEAALDDAADVHGTVRIGLLPAGFDKMLSRLLREVEAKHPGIRLLISDGSSGALEEALDAGRLDLAFVTRVNAPSGESERLLTQNKVDVYIPENFDLQVKEKIALQDLVGVPLIVPMLPNVMRSAIQSAASERGIKLDMRYEINSFGFQMHLLRQGFGCYIGARGIITTVAAPGDLEIRSVRIVDPELIGSIVLVHSSHHPLTRAARTVMDLATRIASELRGSTVW